MGTTTRSAIRLAAGAVAVIVALGSLTVAAAAGANAPSTNTWISDSNGLFSQNSGVTRELILKTIGSLVLVIALGIAAAYVLKRLGPRLGQIQGRQIRLIETTALGPKKALHIVEVEGQRFLIGSTAEQVTMLSPISHDKARPDLPDSGKGW